MDSNQGYNLYKWVICPLTRVINYKPTYNPKYPEPLSNLQVLEKRPQKKTVQKDDHSSPSTKFVPSLLEPQKHPLNSLPFLQEKSQQIRNHWAPKQLAETHTWNTQHKKYLCTLQRCAFLETWGVSSVHRSLPSAQKPFANDFELPWHPVEEASVFVDSFIHTIKRCDPPHNFKWTRQPTPPQKKNPVQEM